jgi:hypothetical protein
VVVVLRAIPNPSQAAQAARAPQAATKSVKPSPRAWSHAAGNVIETREHKGDFKEW